MNKTEFTDRLRNLGTKSKKRCLVHSCKGSDPALETGTSILMDKIRGPYIFGGPLFERIRSKEKLIKILKKLGLTNSEEEAEEALHLMTHTQFPYYHDQCGTFMFKLDCDDKNRKYISNFQEVPANHQGCQRIYTGSDYG